MKKEMYKTSLKLKTVDELVDIILRKDDKERAKNKLISNLERKIHELKNSISETINNIDNAQSEIRKIKNEFRTLLIERNDLQIIVKDYRKQNTILRRFISIFGAVIMIITSLIILFS